MCVCFGRSQPDELVLPIGGCESKAAHQPRDHSCSQTDEPQHGEKRGSGREQKEDKLFTEIRCEGLSEIRGEKHCGEESGCAELASSAGRVAAFCREESRSFFSRTDSELEGNDG